jgi:hypothetical protein
VSRQESGAFKNGRRDVGHFFGHDGRRLKGVPEKKVKKCLTGMQTDSIFNLQVN